jgi:hypothetical protein
MPPDSEATARAEFLCRCKVQPDMELYLIGLAERGITLYKQQVRALNLIYSLHTERLLKATVAVIGGGAAGATAALAAATLGYEVHLFEQRPILFHLQQGCDIRWLHPHIYEWPAAGTDSPYAGLPLLDWQFGTAAEVATRLQAEWGKEIRSNDQMRLTLYMRASAHIAGGVENSIIVRWDNSDGAPRSGERPFDTVIAAVGFGVETGVLEKQAQSYWRNDSVNQPLPGIPSQRAASYFISGTGDGGLIDLLRVCVDDFNQGRILDELIVPDDPLVVRLQGVIQEWHALPPEFRERPEFKRWLFDKYEAMSNEGLFDRLRERLDKRRRKDTTAILNGREPTFSQSLSLGGASLFNTLLVHQLYRLGALSYVPGKCRRVGDSTAQVANGKFTYDYPVDRLIFRHGPLRFETCEAAGMTPEQIDAIKGRAGDIRFYTPQRLWPAGWWLENRKPRVPKEESRIEFVSPVTKVIATTFVKTLGEILVHLEAEKRGKPSAFRVTLHRIVKIREDVSFQQISRYAGTQTTGAVGRVITIKAGLVGLVCHLGAPLIVKREWDFEQLWQDVGLEAAGARGVRPEVQSMLACPFFAPRANPEDPKSVLLVLFMDSEEKGFFDDPAVLKTVYSACKGFVRDLDEMKTENEVRFVTTDWRGHVVAASDEERVGIVRYASIASDDGVFNDFAEDLTFKSVTSLEMHLRGS